jgi:hypothetical protein
METALHRFVDLLRLQGVRISIPEALDAMRVPRGRGCCAIGSSCGPRFVLR